MRRILKAMLPLAILPAFALTGCTSLQDRVEASCERRGLDYGSSEFQDCIERAMDRDQADRAMWTGVAAYGVGVAAQPTYRPWQARCSTWAGVTTCTGD